MAQHQREDSWFRKLQRNTSSPTTIRIAYLPLNHYKPDDISIDVDGDEVTAHGQHRLETENGFETSEFKKSFKLPADVDPVTVKSRATSDGFLVIEGKKRLVEEQEKNNDDGKFEVKLDLGGFTPDDIEVKLEGKELKVKAKRTAEDQAGQWSHDYFISRHIVLPDDVDPSTVTSHLSKAGLLSIEAKRVPALMSRHIDIVATAEDDVPGDKEPHTAGSDSAAEK